MNIENKINFLDKYPMIEKVSKWIYYVIIFLFTIGISFLTYDLCSAYFGHFEFSNRVNWFYESKQHLLSYYIAFNGFYLTILFIMTFCFRKYSYKVFFYICSMLFIQVLGIFLKLENSVIIHISKIILNFIK